MDRKVVTNLLRRIIREAGIVVDVLQCACYGTVRTDGNVRLKIRYSLAEQICACRDIGVNRQAYVGSAKSAVKIRSGVTAFVP
jgi:hypothetical protein